MINRKIFCKLARSLYTYKLSITCRPIMGLFKCKNFLPCTLVGFCNASACIDLSVFFFIFSRKFNDDDGVVLSLKHTTRVRVLSNSTTENIAEYENIMF